MAKLPAAQTRTARSKTAKPVEGEPTAEQQQAFADSGASDGETQPTSPDGPAAEQVEVEIKAPPEIQEDGGGAKAPMNTAGTGGDFPGLDEVTEFLVIGYYGREGSGKTSDVMSMANLGPVLLINAESGAKPTALRRRGVNTQNIQVWPNPERGETLTFDGLEELYYRVKHDLVTGNKMWAGTIWDSLSEIQYKLLYNVRAGEFEKSQRTNKPREDRFFTDRSDFGKMTDQVRDLIRKFRDLPCHFGLTALERRDTDDEGKVEYGPAVTPALMTDIPGFVDILVHTEMVEVFMPGQGDKPERGTGNDEFRGWFRRHGKYRAKDRFGVLPKALPNPTFERVLAYVQGELTPETDPDLEEIRNRYGAAKAADQGTATLGGDAHDKGVEEGPAIDEAATPAA